MRSLPEGRGCVALDRGRATTPRGRRGHGIEFRGILLSQAHRVRWKGLGPLAGGPRQALQDISECLKIDRAH